MDRVTHGWDDNPYADEDGAYVLFTEAQAEIDRRDKRITELEDALAQASKAMALAAPTRATDWPARVAAESRLRKLLP